RRSSDLEEVAPRCMHRTLDPRLLGGGGSDGRSLGDLDEPEAEAHHREHGDEHQTHDAETDGEPHEYPKIPVALSTIRTNSGADSAASPALSSGMTIIRLPTSGTTTVVWPKRVPRTITRASAMKVRTPAHNPIVTRPISA